MGFLAPAVPWIAKGAALLGGFLGGKKAQNAAQQRSPEEQAALSGASTAAGNLNAQGSMLTGMGKPAFTGATNYWSTLLSGNRAAMGQATAAPRAALTDQYRGAETNLERSGVRGAVKDLAKANLSRDMAGKVAGLTTGVQPMAAEQLGSLGSDALRLGTGAYGQAGSLYSNLLGQGFQNRTYARDQGQQAGSSIGGLLFDTLRGPADSLSNWLKNRGNAPIQPGWGAGGAGDVGPVWGG